MNALTFSDLILGVIIAYSTIISPVEKSLGKMALPYIDFVRGKSTTLIDNNVCLYKKWSVNMFTEVKLTESKDD